MLNLDLKPFEAHLLKARRFLTVLSFITMSFALTGCDLNDLLKDSGAQPPISQSQFTNSVSAISHGGLGLNPCAIFNNGQVKCWGENTYGQLGLGDINSRGDNPGEMGANLQIINLGNGSVTAIAETNAGNRCALFTDGRIKCWGSNSLGTLGLGDNVDRITPAQLGDNLPYIDLGANVVAKSIAAGNRTFCAITSGGQVKCWGTFTMFSYNPQNPGFVGYLPGEMGDNLPYVSLPAGRTAKKLSMNNSGTCSVLDDNSLYCWNQLCDSNTGTSTGPFTCSSMATGGGIPLGTVPVGGPVQDITLGSQFACALLTTGQIKCWGENGGGVLGQGDAINRGYDNAHVNDIAATAAVDLGTGRTAVKVSAGAFHVCALLDNGSVKCWGENSYGELGLGDVNGRGSSGGEMGNFLSAVDLGTGRTVLDISAEVIQTCALLDDHSVKCWGANSDGRLGQGDIYPRGTQLGTMGNSLLSIQL